MRVFIVYYHTIGKTILHRAGCGQLGRMVLVPRPERTIAEVHPILVLKYLLLGYKRHSCLTPRNRVQEVALIEELVDDADVSLVRI